MASKNPSQTSVVQDTQPSPCFPSRKPTYEDLKASTANSELPLKKQNTTSQGKAQHPGSSERIQPGPGLVKMASQIQIGELGQPDAKHQQARYGELQQEEANHQFRSALEDARSSNYQELAHEHIGDQRRERAAADQQPGAPLSNNSYIGQMPYHPFMHQQMLMQQQQLLLQLQGQAGGANGVPDQGLGVAPASLMAQQNVLQQYAPFMPRQIPQVPPLGNQPANGEDYNMTSMSPPLPPGQPFFSNNLLMPMSPLMPPIDQQNQNTEHILKQIESYKEMLHEVLKMDQFQSQGTISKSIFSSVEDEGEISYTATVSPAGQSVQNCSMFNGSSGATSSKIQRAQNKTVQLHMTRNILDDVFAAAIDDHIEEEKIEEARKVAQAAGVATGPGATIRQQREILLALIEKAEAPSQDHIQEVFALLAAPGSSQIQLHGLRELLQVEEGHALEPSDVNKIAFQLNENTGESITLQTFSKMVPVLHELYHERIRPRVSLALHERVGVGEEELPQKIETTRKQELVTQSNVNQIQIEARPSQTQREEQEQVAEPEQHEAEVQVSVQDPAQSMDPANAVVFYQDNEALTATQAQKKERGESQRSSLDIDASEFIMAMISEESLLTMPRMKLAFEILDTERSKLIDIEKMRIILVNAIRRSTGDCLITEESIGEALRHCDKNKDDMIQFSEFCNLLLRLHVIFAIEGSRVEQLHVEEETALKAQQRVECRQLLSRLVFDNTVLEIEEAQIKHIYDQLRSEANEHIINKEYSSDLDLYELKQLKFILCSGGRLQESDIDQTAQDVFQSSVRSTIAMEEFLEIILKLKAICLSRSHMDEVEVADEDLREEVLELPDNPANTTIQWICHFKQAHQFQYSTDRASVEESHCEFDINVQDTEQQVAVDRQPTPVEEGGRSLRDDQLNTSQQSNKKIMIMKKKKQGNEAEKGRSEVDRHLTEASPKVQPDVVIKTKRRSSNSKVMGGAETRGVRESSAAKSREDNKRQQSQQLQNDATGVAKDQQLALPPLQFKKEASLISNSYGFSSQNDKESVAGAPAAEPKAENEVVQKAINNLEQQPSATGQDGEKVPQAVVQAPSPVQAEAEKEKDQGKQKKKVKIHELIQKHESQKIPHEDDKEELSEQGSEHFAKLKRVQTMPVRSVLPEDINLDEIESCRISGLSNTRTAGKDNDEKAQQDVVQPMGTPQQIELELELANPADRGVKSPKSRLPPRAPSQQAAAQGSVKSERNAGVPLPTITPKRDVLMNSIISRPSEKYWANFSYVSDERRELEKLIGYNSRSSNNSQIKQMTQDAPSKDGKSPRRMNSNASRNGGLVLNRDDSELLRDVKVFLHHSQNGSDCIVVNNENGDVVDVLTQDKMLMLLKEKRAELEQLEALANSKKVVSGGATGQMDGIVHQKDGIVRAYRPNEHREHTGTIKTEKSLNQGSQEVLDSASYRSSGMLRSMSATNMSMPFLDKVQVSRKESIKKRKPLPLDFNNLSANHDKEIYKSNQAEQISHPRLASTRTENNKSTQFLPPIGPGRQSNHVQNNYGSAPGRKTMSLRSHDVQQSNREVQPVNREERVIQDHSEGPRDETAERNQQAVEQQPMAKALAQERVAVPQQDVGMIRAPEEIHSDEQATRWPVQPLHKLNSKTDMILSKDFRLKESLDNMNQISKKMGQVHDEIMSQRERQKKQQVDRMLLLEQAIDQQLQTRQPTPMPPMPSNNRQPSAPFSSPSDFRYRPPDLLNTQTQRHVVPEPAVNDFQFAGNFAPRPFDESLHISAEKKGSQTRMSYEEVPLEEYFSTRAGTNLMSNAQVYLRFKGFNKQAELEEEQRLKRDGLSLQQQIQDDNQKRNESFVRRLNDDFQLRNENANEGDDGLDVYNEFGDLRQIHKERSDMPNILAEAAQQRQRQQFRIGMFDDVKPLQAVHPGLGASHEPTMYPQHADYQSQEHHGPVGGSSMFGAQPAAQYQHQSGMKAISQSNSLTMSLRHQQQASNRQGHDQQEYINKLVGQGQIIRQNYNNNGEQF